jgi:beta-galactosidase
LLLDFGWRFHFGHANDNAKDFGFGSGRAGGFQKTGGFPFKNDPALASHRRGAITHVSDITVSLQFDDLQ